MRSLLLQGVSLWYCVYSTNGEAKNCQLLMQNLLMIKKVKAKCEV